MARRADEPPPLRLVVAGGFGVAVVLAFVAALALGTRPATAEPGDRIGVTRSAEGAGVAVLVPRCGEERVVGVEVRVPDGPAVWRVVSEKGGIDERFVVGAADPPFGFVTEVPADGPLPGGVLAAMARWERPGPGDTADRLTFDPARLPAEGVLHRGEVVSLEAFERRALAVASCADGDTELGGVTLVFAGGAVVVVVTYLMLVARYLASRRS